MLKTEIIQDDDGSRWMITRSTQDNAVISKRSFLTFNQKLARVREIFGSSAVRFAPRAEWNWNYGTDTGAWRMDGSCPGEVSPLRVRDYPEENTRAYVEFGGIAAGDDTANQVDTTRRSNYRRLREDNQDVFTDMGYSNVNALGAFVGNLTGELLDTLERLHTGYPAYDDDDVSQLEHDEIEESYHSFVKFDIRDYLSEEYLDMWDNIADVKVTRESGEYDAQEMIFWDAWHANPGNDLAEHNGLEICWDWQKTSKYLSQQLDEWYGTYNPDPGHPTIF